MKRGSLLLVAGVLAAIAFGCAGVKPIGVVTLEDGSSVQYVKASSVDIFGQDMTTFDRYHTPKNGNTALIRADATGGPSTGKAALTGSVSGALMGPAAMAVRRPDSVNVGQTSIGGGANTNVNARADARADAANLNLNRNLNLNLNQNLNP